ncbi:MAG: PHP domain-containing protein, partial [Qipengyuania sp.]
MPFAPFVPLRVLSSYSMLEGAIEPKAMAKLAKGRGFPAIAIADRNGLYGAIMFARACLAEGIQPIIGALLGVARPEQDGAEGRQVDYLPLYAQDEAGYQNLCHLVSIAHLDRPLELEPHVRWSDLEGRTEGLIALTGASEGAVTRFLADGQRSHAKKALDRLEALFPARLYIELARRGNGVEEAAEAALVDLAYARDLPLVASNPANYAEPHMHKAHDAMLCIAGSTHVDAEERAHSNPESFVKSASMMDEAFADLPEATANTLVVAQRCAFAPPERDPILPSLAGDQEGEGRLLAEDARKGLEARLAVYEDISAEERGPYFERLDYEVGIINQMGFPGYFLIVADFIKWAKEQDIPVGPGRGSGAGSVVAWALT